MKVVRLVANNFSNPMFLQVFDLFTAQLQDLGLRPLLVNLSDETDPEKSVTMLKQYSVDGVIVASSTLPTAFARRFRDEGVPVVHSFGRLTPTPDVHVVGIDNAECGRIAARTLVDRGYKRIAFMGGPISATSTQDRLGGFISELSKHPDIEHSQSFAEDYTFAAGQSEMARLVADGPAEAYFCGDDGEFAQQRICTYRVQACCS